MPSAAVQHRVDNGPHHSSTVAATAVAVVIEILTISRGVGIPGRHIKVIAHVQQADWSQIAATFPVVLALLTGEATTSEGQTGDLPPPKAMERNPNCTS